MALKEKFVTMLDEGRGRPKKDDSDKDDSGKEGVRDVKLSAKIKIGKKTETAEKILKDLDTDKIDAEIKKFEKALHKKYKYDADDVTITHSIGKYEVEDKASQHMTKDSTEGDEFDGHSFGRKSDEK